MRILNVGKIVTVAVLFAISMINVNGQASSKSFGKGINFMAKDSTMSMKMHVRMQALFSSNYESETEQFNSQLFIRRYRLKFGGFAYTPNLRYKMELGISNRDQGNGSNAAYNNEASNIVLDAVIKYKFANGHWDFWAGQTKLPGNRERVVSSANLQFVDRSNVNSKFNSDRDQGVQLRGNYSIGEMLIRPSFAVTTGEGRNLTTENAGGYDYTSRLELLPLGKFEVKKQDYIEADLAKQSTPKLMLGVTYDYNDRAVRQRGQLGKFIEDTDGNLVSNSLSTIFVDLLFKYKGLSFSSEFATKSAEKQITGLSSNYTTGTGFTAQAGYLVAPRTELALRYTTVSPDNETFSSLTEQIEYTFGFSRYIVGHSLKIQSDVSYFETPNSKTADDIRFRLQMELQI